MKQIINCNYHDPVVPYKTPSEEWTLIDFYEAPLGTSRSGFQFTSSSCEIQGGLETANGFTYGEVFICFFLIVFSMALIFNFIFRNFIKDR